MKNRLEEAKERLQESEERDRLARSRVFLDLGVDKGFSPITDTDTSDLFEAGQDIARFLKDVLALTAQIIPDDYHCGSALYKALDHAIYLEHILDELWERRGEPADKP